jgi:hypothetical protein
MRIRFVTVSLAGALIAVAPTLAHAQMVSPFGKSGGTPTPQAPPPPALPGASSNAGAAPPSRIATDMDPTEALFDAINRGDINAARDAISRGADLRGQNVLSMTPLELSVDLGRNDISFLLLSMRGGDDGRAGPSPAHVAGKPAATKQAKQAPAPRSPGRVATAAPATPRTARLFAGDGGTPNPNAGFLGFGSGQR